MFPSIYVLVLRGVGWGVFPLLTPLDRLMSRLVPDVHQQRNENGLEKEALHLRVVQFWCLLNYINILALVLLTHPY
jgi:hypothetical protein